MRKVFTILAMLLVVAVSAFARERLTLVSHDNDALVYQYEIGRYYGIIITSDGTNPDEDTNLIKSLQKRAFRVNDKLITTNMYAAQMVQLHGFAIYNIGDTDIYSLVLKDAEGYYTEYIFCFTEDA